MLKQSLQQKLLQKLSPQQIQVIKLLEVPMMQLEQRIKKELQENPALEEGAEKNEEYDEDPIEGEETKDENDEFSLDDYLNEEDYPSYKTSANNYSSDDQKSDIPFSTGHTFHEHLTGQLGMHVFNDYQKQLAQYIIGNIDEDGYLRREIDSIVDDLAFSMNVITDEIELREILTVIQSFDPPGVGARDLQECLLLQLLNRKEQTVESKTAIEVIGKYFEEFTKKHYDKILQKTELEEEHLKDALDEILKLNPKPGSSYSDPHNKTAQYINPDFILESNNEGLSVSLNTRNAPELRVSRKYEEMLRGYEDSKKTKSDKEAVLFVKQKLDSAKWFIDAIRQRQNTLMLTMNAILEFQYDYFDDGDETKLKPMILKDIAEPTELDVSTISRVVNSKYIQTHFGILSLKSFFSEGMQTGTGEEVSTREIKSILQDCIDAENKKKPLTDEKLAEILKEKNYPVARRTVAKYREQLGIPVARMRKEL